MHCKIFVKKITVFYAVFCGKNVIKSDLIVTPEFLDFREILLLKFLIKKKKIIMCLLYIAFTQTNVIRTCYIIFNSMLT